MLPDLLARDEEFYVGPRGQSLGLIDVLGFKHAESASRQHATQEGTHIRLETE